MDLKEVQTVIESSDLKAVSKDEFMAAAQRIKAVKTLNQDQQLLLYGLYKQGTVGDVNTPQPYAFNITDSLKWFVDDLYLLYCSYIETGRVGRNLKASLWQVLC